MSVGIKCLSYSQVASLIATCTQQLTSHQHYIMYMHLVVLEFGKCCVYFIIILLYLFIGPYQRGVAVDEAPPIRV